MVLKVMPSVIRPSLFFIINLPLSTGSSNSGSFQLSHKHTRKILLIFLNQLRLSKVSPFRINISVASETLKGDILAIVDLHLGNLQNTNAQFFCVYGTIVSYVSVFPRRLQQFKARENVLYLYDSHIIEHSQNLSQSYSMKYVLLWSECDPTVFIGGNPNFPRLQKAGLWMVIRL